VVSESFLLAFGQHQDCEPSNRIRIMKNTKKLVVVYLSLITLVVLGGFALLYFVNRNEPAAPKQTVANPVGWAKLVSTPTQVAHVGMLWQVDFQITDSETVSAMIVEGGNNDTVNLKGWKIGDEVFISSILGKGHQHQSVITYIVIDHRSASSE
jgi:hypothetical protein